MPVNRRNFIKSVGIGLAALNMPGMMGRSLFAMHEYNIPGVGMCDWTMGKMASPDAIALAKQANLTGVQVSLGSGPDNLPLREDSVRKQYIELSKQYGVTCHSVALGMLNSIPLATEPQSAVFVIDALETAAALGAKNILLAFFGNGDLRMKNSRNKYRDLKEGNFSSFELDTAKVTRVVECIRQVVNRAEDLNVIVGLENTITAQQNLEIIDRIGSDMVQIYYDVGNSWGNGYDVPGELRSIGNSRLCEVHLKDWNTPMLGSGKAMVDMAECAKALHDIGYDKWLVLETAGRKNQFLADTKTNVKFVKSTFSVS